MALFSASERRAAQTVMFEVLRSLLKVLAPILPFSAEEAWRKEPHLKAESESVHLAAWPEVAAYRDEELDEPWDKLLGARHEVMLALEAGKRAGTFKGSLEARCELHTPRADLRDLLAAYDEGLAGLFGVSSVHLHDPGDEPPGGSVAGQKLKELNILVAKATGEKCERCLFFFPKVGEHGYEGACERCSRVLKEIGWKREAGTEE